MVQENLQLKKNEENIVLIGMPGVGKSTIGVILAKVLGKKFVDTDLYIQQNENMLLHDIIDKYGIEIMLEKEENNILKIYIEDSVIATGGSVVYSEKTMRKLSDSGIIIYLNLPFDEIEKRVENIKTRGVIKKPDQTFYELYLERLPLYKKYAQITINCYQKNIEAIVEEIKNNIKQ